MATTQTPPANAAAERPKIVMKAMNAIMSTVLRSPFHGRVSKRLMLLELQGKKSGKRYRFPVGYMRKDANELAVLTDRPWWKNLRGGAPVTVYLEGQKRGGTAEPIREATEVADAIETSIRRSPRIARIYRVELDEKGEPKRASVEQVSPNWTLVRIHLG